METSVLEQELMEASLQITPEEQQQQRLQSNDCDLASFLIGRACMDPVLTNYLFWYLKVECEIAQHNDAIEKSDVRDMYKMMLKRLSKALLQSGPEARRRRAQLVQQQLFVERLVVVMKSVAKESGNLRRKIDFLQGLLAADDGDSHSNSAAAAASGDPYLLGDFNRKINFQVLGELPLPLDPNIRIKAIIASKASLFNSALMPAKLTFLAATNEEYVTIFKHGDDLRQDQLVLQIFTLMDRLLKRENLDLKLTTYRVLATSAQHGFVQFIDSQPLRDVSQQWEGNIQVWQSKKIFQYFSQCF